LLLARWLGGVRKGGIDVFRPQRFFLNFTKG